MLCEGQKRCSRGVDDHDHDVSCETGDNEFALSEMDGDGNVVVDGISGIDIRAVVINVRAEATEDCAYHRTTRLMWCRECFSNDIAAVCSFQHVIGWCESCRRLGVNGSAQTT